MLLNKTKPIEEIDEKELDSIIPTNCDMIFYEYSATKSLSTRNKIIENNRPLVSFIINKYYSSKSEYRNLREDLLQEGTIGLVAAVEGFKPELGYRFSSYSSWWIRQAINNYLLNVEPIIHVPSHVRAANNKLIKKLKEENISLQSFIDNYKNGNYTNKMMYSISCANKVKNVISLEDTKVYKSKDPTNGSQSLKDIMPASENTQPDTIFDNRNMITVVRKALDKLSDKERYILLLRFSVMKKIPKKHRQNKGK